MTDRPLLETESLGYDVSTRTLWNDLELTVSPGAAIAIRGASGQGKSTLLRCLGGLQRPARGVVRVLGTDVHGSSANQRRLLRRDVVGFVMQDHAIVPEWSVARNLAVVRPRRMTRKDLDSRIIEALEIVGLGGRQNLRAGLLSGGEQQRVAVARVLAQRPRIVLADEPTASLDDVSAARVRSGLDAVRSRGGAVIVATHDPALWEWSNEEVVLV